MDLFLLLASSDSQLYSTVYARHACLPEQNILCLAFHLIKPMHAADHWIMPTSSLDYDFSHVDHGGPWHSCGLCAPAWAVHPPGPRHACQGYTPHRPHAHARIVYCSRPCMFVGHACRPCVPTIGNCVLKSII